jgi:nicotinate-nucleotide pyrophosphorylase (carboxylating)
MLDRFSFIKEALEEDLGSGDHTSEATIPVDRHGFAKLFIKEDGILSGCQLAIDILHTVDPNLIHEVFLYDAQEIKSGQIAFSVQGSLRSILLAERLLLNCMQRLSGVATMTSRFVGKVQGTKTKILDTRKTTPLMRILEKEAVRHGGGENHRFGLFDMILIKDNHIDANGRNLVQTLENARTFNRNRPTPLRIEVETRTLEDVQRALDTGIPDRIMFDNFTPEMTRKGVELVSNHIETESSGGITIDNVRDYAETGVDFISVGALTHSVKSLDMSLKIVL